MPNQILPHDLPNALEGQAGISVLSLDCFDTLLWRDTHAPRDIFSLLPGATPQQRIWAESGARRAAMVRERRSEVSIEEIYDELMPNASAADRAVAVRAEIEAEILHCFAFAPTVALMREARRRGIEIVIVSDTYLSPDQLAELIRRAAGDETADLIDRIFCSSAYGASKGDGLFAKVLTALQVRPQAILHVGDNREADVDAAGRLGIKALHLLQFAETTVQRLRLEAAVGAIIDGGGAAFQPHRASLAAGEPQCPSGAEALGFGVLGPLLVPFTQWLAKEADALATPGRKVHSLFLMRDGHLPHRMFAAVFPAHDAHAIEISRFTALGASFVDAAAVQHFVEAELGNGKPDEILRQLLFRRHETSAMLRTLPRVGQLAALAREIAKPDRMRTIIARSHGLAARLVRYLRMKVDPAPGDIFMLVDLGYNGTVQNRIASLVETELGVHIAGRYLLLREQQVSGRDKAGFIGDADQPAALEMLASAIAVLEQLCTAAQGSVIDYGDAGAPVRAGSSIKARQSDTREAVQRGALDFARNHGAAVIRASAPPLIERRAATATLARLLFLPMPHELAVLEAFEHDVNLGGGDTVALFDPKVAARGMRERGLFYLKGADRMYLPAELRGQGLATNLTLLTQQCFGLDLRYADFCDSGIDLPLLISLGRDVVETSVRAMPTHDGYYLAAIPLGAQRYSVGIQFGRRYEWLQIQSASFVPIRSFLAEGPAANVQPIEGLPSLEGIVQTAPHLFRCDDANGFLMVPPSPMLGDEATMLMVVFRPLVERAQAAASATVEHAQERIRR